jgi:hypothetical protein
MKRFLTALWPRLIASLVVVGYLEVLRALSYAPWPPGRPQAFGVLLRWLYAQSVLEMALWLGQVRLRPGPRASARRWVFSWRFGALFVLWIVLVLGYVLTLHSLAAWAASLVSYALLVAASSLYGGRHWAMRILGWGFLALVGGTVPVIVGQIESRFSEEEFFAALQIVSLCMFSALLLGVHLWLVGYLGRRGLDSAQRGRHFAIPNRAIVAGALIILILGGGLAVRSYRHSFYPGQAPTFPGIAPKSPFLCGQGTPDPATPGGEETFQRLLARVEAHPTSTTTKYGMLALATGEARWAAAFREAVLADARNEKYTEPANSVKSTQHQAARLGHYYARMVDAYPDLLSSNEQDVVRAWLSSVNRRALTVEWVDWLYALAFSYWPAGAYENQENGAALLALLESQGLVDDASLSDRNQDYLRRNRRGWFERFRNTDDAYRYQPEWIDNALFQDEYWRERADAAPQVARNRALAFEWLLLQALPDGAPLNYNYPVWSPVAQAAYLGATLLDDPRYVWWSARLLDWLEEADHPLYAQPGLEGAASLPGLSPRVGSCLMYGDSGLPTQQGPLAPDKIVFRDGWMSEGRYLMLNLRFSGWHRYKATNTVTSLYQMGPIVIESAAQAPYSWLPAGRSLFRDKRIPRENLNGLLIPRSGMSAVLYGLTGVGGPWAQDPPHYARVVAFETGEEADWSHTRLSDWRGWQHDRWVHFLREGAPIVVVDKARGPSGRRAALTWHLHGGMSDMQGWRLLVRGGDDPAEAVWVPLGESPGALSLSQPEHSVVGYEAGEGGRLDLATVFLMGPWVGARVQLDAESQVLQITSGQRLATVPLYPVE